MNQVAIDALTIVINVLLMNLQNIKMKQYVQNVIIIQS